MNPSLKLSSAHGALMDPDYLRQTQTRYPTQGAAPAVLHTALAMAFAVPVIVWIVGSLTGV